MGYCTVFLDADAITEAYLRGKPMAIDLFGPDVFMGGPHWRASLMAMSMRSARS